jgi:hypothetical protein
MSAPPRPTQAEMRAAEATWGERPRPAMRLLGWKSLVKGSLRGFATAELPAGLRIHEIPVLSSNGKTCATFPSRPVLDREGRQVETNAKRQYSAMLEWRSRELGDAFSTKVIELVRQAHRDALDGEGAP